MILDAAFEVFLERGYEGASMEAIARRVGVSKPVVYSSFPSKEALFGELLRREEQRILEAITGSLPAKLDTDLHPVIVDALGAFLEAVREAPAAFQVVFLGAGGTDAAINRRVQRGRQAQTDAIAALVEAWLVEQRVPDAERQGRLLGFLLAGLAEAAARALLAEPERWTPHELAEQVARLVLQGQGGIVVPR
jgi:AcrR family transcriptional regulator